MGNDARQLAILAAIVIDVYRLRSTDTLARTHSQRAMESSDGAAPAEACFVIAAESRLRRDTRSAQRIAQIVRAIGAREAQTRWIDVAADGAIASVPDAAAYLLVGSVAARTCSASMPIERQQAAANAVIDDLAAFDSGSARRVLW